MFVKFVPSAKRELRAISRENRVLATAIMEAIYELTSDPFPGGSIAMRGHANLHRIRIESYRVVYRVTNNMVIVTRIRHRSMAYEGLDVHL